jgi:hypothetical protein
MSARDLPRPSQAPSGLDAGLGRASATHPCPSHRDPVERIRDVADRSAWRRSRSWSRRPGERASEAPSSIRRPSIFSRKLAAPAPTSAVWSIGPCSTRSGRFLPGSTARSRKPCTQTRIKRYAELSEFLYDLRHPSPAFLSKTRPPLLERNPAAFWKGLSALLALVMAWLLTHLR